MILVVLNWLRRNRLSRHAILFANPLIEINKLAAFGTKRPEGIILQRDLFVAGRTLFHEPKMARLTD
jgi:hypothetical protein